MTRSDPPRSRGGDRPSLPAPDRRHQRLRVHLTDAEHAELLERAQAAGLSLEDYLHEAALGRPLSRTDRQAVAELVRIRGLLDEAARYAPRCPRPAVVETAVAQAIREVDETLHRLRDS